MPASYARAASSTASRTRSCHTPGIEPISARGRAVRHDEQRIDQILGTDDRLADERADAFAAAQAAGAMRHRRGRGRGSSLVASGFFVVIGFSVEVVRARSSPASRSVGRGALRAVGTEIARADRARLEVLLLLGGLAADADPFFLDI